MCLLPVIGNRMSKSDYGRESLRTGHNETLRREKKQEKKN